MNRKITASVLCLFLITIGLTPVISADEDSDLKENLIQIEQKISLADEESDPFIYLTSGPASDKYSEIELLDGSPEEIQKIEKHLSGGIFRASTFLPYVVVFITTPLNFTVCYDVEGLREGSRNSYFSFFANATYDEEGNLEEIVDDEIVYNEIHKVKVENFTGVFFFARAKLFAPPTYYIKPIFLPMLFSIIYYKCSKTFFIPARFSFIGSCDNITDLLIFK